MIGITSFIRSFSIDFPTAEGTDIAGYIIHACPATEFIGGDLVPSESNKIYQGPDNFYFYTIPEDKLGGTWGVKVAAYDTFGLDEINYSDLYTVNISTLDPLDTVPPSKVCITSYTTGIDNNAAVDNTYISVSWKFCDDSPTPVDFSHYVVGWRLQGESTFIEAFTNEAYHKFEGLIPGRFYEFKVRGVDQWLNMGEWSDVLEVEAAVDTAPPAAVANLEVTSAIYTLFASWSANTESDFAEYEVWISEYPDLVDAVVERTRTTFFTYKGEAGKTYYLSVSAVDYSGNHSAFSPVVAVALNKLDPLDTTPPGVPVWISSSTGIAESGPVDEVYINVRWALASIPHDFSNYVLGYKLSTDSDYTEIQTPDTYFKLNGLIAGRVYHFRVCAVDQWLNSSNWSEVRVVTAAKDTTPPPTVTGVVATSAMSTVFLKWNTVTLLGGEAVRDLKQYWVQVATSSNFSNAQDFDTVDTSFTYSGETNTTYYARVKAGDYSGNYSTQWSTVVNTTTSLIQSTDIDNFAIDASKMFNYVPVIKEASSTVWSVNPATETVSWAAHTVIYKDKIFNVAAGSTTFGYIYGTFSGEGGAFSYSTTTSPPAGATDRFVMAKNTRGKLEIVWNAQANMVIGSAHIMDAAITNAKVGALDADRIQTGQFDAERINVGSIELKDLKGAITWPQLAGNPVRTYIDGTGVYTRKIAANQIVVGVDTDLVSGANIGDGGSLTFNDPKIKLDGVNNRISISDAGKERVQIGKVQKVADDAGAGNSTYGIIISDDSGKPVFRVYEGKAVIENLTGGEINANVVNLHNLHADEITVGQLKSSQIDVGTINIADLDGVISWPQLAGTPAHTYIGANGLYTGTVRAQDVLLGAAAGVGTAGDLIFPNPQVKIEGANARLLIRNNANTQDMVQIGKLGATNYGILVNNENGTKVFSVDETGATIQNATVGTLDCSQATLQGLKVGNIASPGYIQLDPNATIEWTNVNSTPQHYVQTAMPTGVIPAGSTWFNNKTEDDSGDDSGDVYKKQTLYIYKNGVWVRSSNVGTYIGSSGLYTGTVTANQIRTGSVEVGQWIGSSNYSVDNATGWAITGAGDATFMNAYVRGNIQASSLKADTVMVERLHVQGHAITDVTSGMYDYTDNPTLPVELYQARPFPSDSFGGVVTLVFAPIGVFPSSATMTYTVILENSQTRQRTGSAVAGTETIVVSTSSEEPLGIIQPPLFIAMTSTNIGVNAGRKGWYVYITKFILYR